jgi:hypothetical protein
MVAIPDLGIEDPQDKCLRDTDSVHKLLQIITGHREPGPFPFLRRLLEIEKAVRLMRLRSKQGGYSKGRVEKRKEALKAVAVDLNRDETSPTIS